MGTGLLLLLLALALLPVASSLPALLLLEVVVGPV
jgi:hypothetical protein